MSRTLQPCTSFSTRSPQLTLFRRARGVSTIRCSSMKEIETNKVVASTAALTAVACVLPQVASAAQEVFVLAEGEPLIVQAGWAALAASFTMSIAIVVWGRSGL